MKNAVIYVHGKGGNAEEANHYKQFFDDSFEIIGFDYKSLNPWDAKIEFIHYFNSIISKYNKIYLIANSIGAYFSLISLSDMPIEKAMLISPIIDMERIILNIMKCENITEDELILKKDIETSFGESLSWQYLSYVRKNTIHWDIPTNILFADNDNMTSVETMTNFAGKINADLTVMENGEHWFHTEEQMTFLDNWFKANI
ncbi:MULTISPECIES: alpha/beta hydrolase [unclassified Treponema]|uniref:alpha/beta hydrolase n=1 Tax=unclassified Treponema TaxID=2638727 RepID=UPI0020A3EBBC|nr:MULTISPECIES: alpha/beta hydrolase [unclassified Treponema]UTC66152.1 alpha/beta hydrolase [Treponema sp. OMZ 789]UTC68881.1 alpha/beta hydrolase [Treponema sp. OMZ 790]UTC71609.1 alpha/beta hydrolase [Treponema sp. OMZ 791]